jgi:hypothetical protein
MAAATGDGVCVRIEALPAGSGRGDGGILRTPSLFRWNSLSFADSRAITVLEALHDIRKLLVKLCAYVVVATQRCLFTNPPQRHPPSRTGPITALAPGELLR